MELKDLKKMTSTKLKEEALKYPEIEGVHGMNKAQLVEALAQIYGIKLEEETKPKKPRDIGGIKKEIKRLKELREEQISQNNRQQIQRIRQKIKRFKRRTRTLTQ